MEVVGSSILKKTSAFPCHTQMASLGHLLSVMLSKYIFIVPSLYSSKSAVVSSSLFEQPRITAVKKMSITIRSLIPVSFLVLCIDVSNIKWLRVKGIR